MQNPIVLLGVPVDNVTMDQAVERIMDMTDMYLEDSRPRYVATVNVDFLVNALSWSPGNIRHPELIGILRRADLITADGMPIVWTSRLLGSPLKERVTGADLVPRLAKEAARSGKSIFLLGGNNGAGKQAARVLQSENHGLRIAGVSSPYVHTEGINLLESGDRDIQIIDEINRSGADILLIGFGNPKQEIWFERNRSRMKIPVSIGVGGTYEFIAGSVKRAPAWMQKTGIEWIFRIIQDPKRLWKRYLVGFFKFGFMVFPAVLFYRYMCLRERMGRKGPEAREERQDRPQHPVTGSLKSIMLPDRLDAASLDLIGYEREHTQKYYSGVVLDFRKTSFIDSTGLGFIIKIWKQCRKDGISLYMTSISPPIKDFFTFNRVWDLFKEIAHGDMDELLQRIRKETVVSPVLVVKDIGPDVLSMDLQGRLDADQMSRLDIASLINEIGSKDCILNLSELDFVDSTGLVLFLKIQRHLAVSNRIPVLCGLSDNILQMFRITKLVNLFHIEPDVISATKKLRVIK